MSYVSLSVWVLVGLKKRNLGEGGFVRERIGLQRLLVNSLLPVCTVQGDSLSTVCVLKGLVCGGWQCSKVGLVGPQKMLFGLMGIFPAGLGGCCSQPRYQKRKAPSSDAATGNKCM